MEELINAIEKLTKKDIIDYLIVIVPIVVSIVAIVISIATARKQNKIAMFERRYNCFFQIKTILDFSKTIEDPFDKKVIISLFDSFWGTAVAQLSGDEQLISAICQFEIIKKDVEQATLLFDYKFKVPPKDILSNLQSVILDLLLDKTIDPSRAEFVSTCKEFKEKDFENIQKFVKL